MAKFVAIAAVCLAAILAVAAGQGETEQEMLKDMQCVREVQESPLDACRQVLHRQLTGSRTGYGPGPFQWGTGLRMQCCQQLQDVSRECRCAAILRMVRGYEQSMPPLEGGGGGFYGEGAQCGQQQGGSYSSGCGEMGWRRRQEGRGYYGGAGQQGGQGCGCGCGQKTREEYGRSGQQPATRVRLGKVRQYAAQLPTMCRIEPQECSVFSGAERESY